MELSRIRDVSTLAILKKRIKQQKPQIIFPSETKRNSTEIKRIFRLSLGFYHYFAVDTISKSCGLTGFYYEHPDTSHRSESWAPLKSLKSASTLPWLCLGDFNEILNQSEREGENPRPLKQNGSFSGDHCEFAELKFKGLPFTTSSENLIGKILRERLHRTLMTRKWWELFPRGISHHVPVVRLDHFILVKAITRMGTTEVRRTKSSL
ncbi:hypothetical protein SLA2020_345940, partial [Shorea laevis]